MRRIDEEIDVPCRYCGAQPGEQCKGPDGKYKRSGLVHNVRADDADKAEAEERARKKATRVRTPDPEHPGTYKDAGRVDTGNTEQS
jgi:hypothetical protein